MTILQQDSDELCFFTLVLMINEFTMKTMIIYSKYQLANYDALETAFSHSLNTFNSILFVQVNSIVLQLMTVEFIVSF